MNNRASLIISTVVMIIALLLMAINTVIISMSDWTVRIAGMVIIVDLVILVYSYVRIRNKRII